MTKSKTSLTIMMKSFRLKNSLQNTDREMLIRTLRKTLLQTFCKIILNSKVIVIISFDPDDNFWRNSLSIKSWHPVVMPQLLSVNANQSSTTFSFVFAFLRFVDLERTLHSDFIQIL